MALDVKEVERLARGYVEYAAASGDVQIELEGVAYEIYDIRDGHCPEDMWPIILRMLDYTDNPKVLGRIAAGPLEDLLSTIPNKAIVWAEVEARRNSKFKNLLKGVWQNSMPNEVWARVQSASR